MRRIKIFLMHTLKNMRISLLKVSPVLAAKLSDMKKKRKN